MNNDTLALLLALGATLSFSAASLVFAEYSKKISVIWMNCFKALVAFAALALTIPIFVGWHRPEVGAVGGLFLSGWIGLNLGDLFLLSAFTRLGPARTLILFGFQPLMVGVGAYFLFGQAIPPARFVAVIFLIACLFTFSLERYRQNRSWEITGLAHALTGVALDTCGILITRASFAASPAISPLEGHFYRCAGALLGFAAFAVWAGPLRKKLQGHRPQSSPTPPPEVRSRTRPAPASPGGESWWVRAWPEIKPLDLVANFRSLSSKTKFVLIGASLAGTYLSLALYLSAVKIGQLASISGIAITGPIFATGLELLIHRRAPSRYLIAAIAFFSIGFYILLRTA